MNFDDIFAVKDETIEVVHPMSSEDKPFKVRIYSFGHTNAFQTFQLKYKLEDVAKMARLYSDGVDVDMSAVAKEFETLGDFARMQTALLAAHISSWEGLTDKTGPIAFSYATAIELLHQNKPFRDWIQEMTSAAAEAVREQIANEEDVKKN